MKFDYVRKTIQIYFTNNHRWIASVFLHISQDAEFTLKTARLRFAGTVALSALIRETMATRKELR